MSFVKHVKKFNKPNINKRFKNIKKQKYSNNRK